MPTTTVPSTAAVERTAAVEPATAVETAGMATTAAPAMAGMGRDRNDGKSRRRNQAGKMFHRQFPLLLASDLLQPWCPTPASENDRRKTKARQISQGNAVMRRLIAKSSLTVADSPRVGTPAL
jgi:hypothetical protein